MFKSLCKFFCSLNFGLFGCIVTNFYIHFHSDELYWVHEMRLEFNEPPNMCNKHSKKISAEKLDVRGEYMDVTFDTGFNRKHLLSLLSEMVCWGICAVKNECNFECSMCFVLFCLVWHHPARNKAVNPGGLRYQLRFRCRNCWL